jgi:hypothetical protein
MVLPDTAIEHTSFMVIRWVNVIGSQIADTGLFWAIPMGGYFSRLLSQGGTFIFGRLAHPRGLELHHD